MENTRVAAFPSSPLQDPRVTTCREPRLKPFARHRRGRVRSGPDGWLRAPLLPGSVRLHRLVQRDGGRQELKDIVRARRRGRGAGHSPPTSRAASPARSPGAWVAARVGGASVRPARPPGSRWHRPGEASQRSRSASAPPTPPRRLRSPARTAHAQPPRRARPSSEAPVLGVRASERASRELARQRRLTPRKAPPPRRAQHSLDTVAGVSSSSPTWSTPGPPTPQVRNKKKAKQQKPFRDLPETFQLHPSSPTTYLESLYALSPAGFSSWLEQSTAKLLSCSGNFGSCERSPGTRRTPPRTHVEVEPGVGVRGGGAAKKKGLSAFAQ